MQLSAKELANILHGSIEGDPDVIIDRPSKIEEGGKGSISFLGNERYEPYVYTTTASVLLVSRDFQPKGPISSTLIRVDDVYASIALLLEKFGSSSQFDTGISNQALIHPNAVIGKDVAVGPFSVIEEGARIGEGVRIASQVYIGKNVEIGAHTLIYPGVRVLHQCRIGDQCIIHSNAVIGSDGFGFAPQNDGTYKKITQTGNVVVENQVEIGANTTIDRATMGSTIIRSGVKLDNLIQVAHNVEIGENTVIAAQVGIAGSTKIGKNCRIGGQAGIIGHLHLADGTQIQAQSGVISSTKQPNTALSGSPALGYKDYFKAYAVFRKLPDLYKKIKELEEQINNHQK